MKELREMTEREVRAFDGTKVIKLYSDFDEKLNGKPTVYPKSAFPIHALPYGKWYTDGDGLYIHFSRHNINTVDDFLSKGYEIKEAEKMATNDEVTVTSICKTV